MTTTDFDLLAHLIAAAPPLPAHLLPPQAELEPAPAKPDPHDFIPLAAIEAGAERYQRARWDHARARADRERRLALAKDMAWRAEWAAAAYQAAKDLHHRLREERQARAQGARR